MWVSEKKTQESEQEESEAVTKEREITERLHSRNRDGQTDRLAKDDRDGGRTRESNMLEIKSDRTHRAKGRKKERNYGCLSFYPLSPQLLSAIRVLHHSGSHLP